MKTNKDTKYTRLFSDYINSRLEGVPDINGSLERYKNSVLRQMEEAALSDAYKDLQGEEILELLKEREFAHLRSDYRKIYEAQKARKRSGAVGAAVALGSVAYMLMLVVLYVGVSFITHLWSYTWLILFGGITLWAGALLVYSVKKAIVNKRVYGAGVRFFSALVIMLFTTHVFLCLKLIFHLPYSWVVFIAGVIAVFAADVAFSLIFRQKHKVVNFIFDIPVMATLLYVALGSLRIIPWNPGWLMIIVSLIIDIIIIIVSLIKKSGSFKKESEDVWNEN